MSLPKPNNQTTVVITGASSGIGVELARGLAGRGFPLMLVARRRERLDELADQLRQEHCVGVEVLPLDLADTQARAQLADRLRSDAIAGLCNSAGFGTSGRFWELPFARESEEVVLNALALMELTHAALPAPSGSAFPSPKFRRTTSPKPPSPGCSPVSAPSCRA
ncbi:ketoacyl reductase [Mycobacterium tuberculosis]|nr:ketoacyl reductase [Mycobacterium tuberculosis TKK_03_0160]KAV53445.1 ketoacyl reductase [Mycobacterium tuberculosis TKK_05SA_0019]KCA96574.1 ketoacyl reductase [Mycobacterium tuberculosis TKK-01-0088]KCD91754.1 ketoacyl reductase [Mycobacterium tuberculosis TKK_04_0001]CNC32224.1 ketoacyl reductase [Mycobacterium tuberculosis]